mgnify:CR=1 FL=1
MAHKRPSDRPIMAGNDLKFALLTGILVALLAVCSLVLLSYVLILIAFVIWSPPPPDVYESLASSGSELLRDPRLWIAYMLWGAVSGVIARQLGESRKLYPALTVCLLLLLFTYGWFGSLRVCVNRLGTETEWRNNVLYLTARAIDLAVPAIMVMGMTRWQSYLRKMLIYFPKAGGSARR